MREAVGEDPRVILEMTTEWKGMPQQMVCYRNGDDTLGMMCRRGGREMSNDHLPDCTFIKSIELCI